MVLSLGPGKFYGSSLPRPRIYTDIKFNSDRVDPPLPVMDPFLSWAQEAHWSMGGLSFQRLRFQGRIEGNANKLRKRREKEAKLQASNSPKGVVSGGNERDRKRVSSDSPPPAPKIVKRRRFMDLFDEDSEGEENEIVEKVNAGEKKRLPARKLVGEFEKVAKEGDVVGVRTRRKKVEEGSGGDLVMKVAEELNRQNVGKKLKGGKKGRSGGESESSPVSSVRTSPRLAKRRSN